MLYKRSKKPGAYWWVRFECRGAYVRQSSGTDRKELAQAFERELREAIWNEQNLGIEVHTWEEACERWLKEKAHKRSIARDRQAITAISAHVRGKDLADIGAEHIRLIGEGLAMRSSKRSSRSNGGRELAVLRSVLNACVKWGWLDRAPKVEMPHAEKSDPRWISEEQFEKLRFELPPHAQALASFAVSTGLRSANVRRLRWGDVDLAKRVVYVHGDESKSGRPMGIPLSGPAVRVLRRQVGYHKDYVFTDDAGRAPVGSIKTCWLKAVKRAGLEGFRFHDLRHTWAAWHVLAGTPPTILKELGGWASLAMVERYGHIGTGHLADWANNSRTKTGTGRNSKKRK